MLYFSKVKLLLKFISYHSVLIEQNSSKFAEKYFMGDKSKIGGFLSSVKSREKEVADLIITCKNEGLTLDEKYWKENSKFKKIISELGDVKDECSELSEIDFENIEKVVLEGIGDQQKGGKNEDLKMLREKTFKFGLIEDKKSVSIFKKISPWLVLIHTHLFMTIYYGNAPTSGNYSKALKIEDSLLGIIKAITPIVGFLSTFVYNAIIGDYYTIPYIFSFGCLSIGGSSYFLAKSFDSVALIIIGRTFIGLGAGRVITRKYYSVEVDFKDRKFWGSLLTASTALSITLGPGLSSLAEFIPSQDFQGIEVHNYNVFSLIFTICMVTLWGIFHLLFEDGSNESRLRNLFVPSSSPPKGDKKVKERNEEKYIEEESLKPAREILYFDYSMVDCMELPSSNRPSPMSLEKGIKILARSDFVKEYFPIYFIAIFFTYNKSV